MKYPNSAIALVSLALVPFLCQKIQAQNPEQAAARGSVTGHVTCADTQRPARFAYVILYGVPTEITPAPKADTKQVGAQLMANIAGFGASHSENIQTQTDSEGNFSASSIPPGDYYVFATMRGYVAPKYIVQAAYDAGANLRKSVPGVPIVHVVADRASHADLTIERGAAVHGKLAWDDGSPVPGAAVTVVSAKNDQKELPLQFTRLSDTGGGSSVSDDLGQFRISGLAAGDYLVKATLQTRVSSDFSRGISNMDAPLVVFAPGTLHRSAAKPVTLRASENRGDLEVTVNLVGMHSVSGRLISAEDRHGINSGKVKIEDTQDNSFFRSAGVDADGNFTVTLVPPGTYNLLVSGAEDTAPPKEGGFARRTLRSYGNAEQSIIVMDRDLIAQNIELAPKSTDEKNSGSTK